MSLDILLDELTPGCFMAGMGLYAMYDTSSCSETHNMYVKIYQTSDCSDDPVFVEPVFTQCEDDGSGDDDMGDDDNWEYAHSLDATWCT